MKIKQIFFEKVIRFRIPIMIVFIIAAIMGAYCRNLIAVNYDMNDYLPADSPSTVALDLMQDEFDGEIPNARVAVKNVSYKEALEYKQKLEEVEGVESVTWLDDSNYLNRPIEMLDQDTVESYYKNNTALYTITIEEERIVDAVPIIREIIGEDNAMTGSAVSTAIATASTVSEIRKIVVIALIIVLGMLLLTTSSWIEPVIILAGIGVAVIINAGSNLIFGEISFVTNAAGNILQLAVSLDYSVFLIHRFTECRKEESNPKKAMISALCKSTSSILSSGLTTVIGFLALLLMRFQIGPDLGRALAKGISISLITVFVFMPGLILIFYPLMDKTTHKPILPSFRKFGQVVGHIAIPCALIFVFLIVPSYFCSNHNGFYYGSSHIFDLGTQYGDDTAYIVDAFGIKDTYVLMVANDDDKTERALVKELESIDEVISVTSLPGILGPSVPVQMIPDSLKKKLRSEHYDRILLQVGTDYEGEETFALVENIRSVAEEYYEGNWYLAGQGVSTYDLMDTITDDMPKVNMTAIIAVFLVLLITMRSLKLPVVLVLTIETAIWINLTVPYIMGDSIFYIAYLIISSVQLGATVDYAILLTDRYRECRELYSKKESIVETISQVTVSMLTSGLVLTSVGFLLGFISTHGLLAQLGILLGRGTVCSLISVLFVLPGFLYITDRKK